MGMRSYGLTGGFTANISIGWSPLPKGIPRSRPGCPTCALLITFLVVVLLMYLRAHSSITRRYDGLELWRDDCVARWLVRRADLQRRGFPDERSVWIVGPE